MARPAAFWVAMPVIGGLLGLALASKWVGLYAIGGIALLILVRSALGRVVAILALIGDTASWATWRSACPRAQGVGNLTFLIVMVALTLLAVVVAVVHPIAWTDDEMRFAVIAPAALGALVFFGALATGQLDAALVVGPLAITPLRMAIALALGSLAVVVLFYARRARSGSGRWRRRRGPTTWRGAGTAGPAAEGWLRPGWLLGLPVVWAAVCLLAMPVVVYVVSRTSRGRSSRTTSSSPAGRPATPARRCWT